ncbi:MAG: hypothetical protein ACJAYX_004274 [Planctomycetota bacterium]|jgi:hypothetical protein
MAYEAQAAPLSETVYSAPATLAQERQKRACKRAKVTCEIQTPKASR